MWFSPKSSLIRAAHRPLTDPILGSQSNGASGPPYGYPKPILSWFCSSQLPLSGPINPAPIEPISVTLGTTQNRILGKTPILSGLAWANVKVWNSGTSPRASTQTGLLVAKDLASYLTPFERYMADKVLEKRCFNDFGSSLLTSKTRPFGLIFVSGLPQWGVYSWWGYHVKQMWLYWNIALAKTTQLMHVFHSGLSKNEISRHRNNIFRNGLRGYSSKFCRYYIYQKQHDR